MQLIEASIEERNKMLLVWDEPLEFAGVQFDGYTIVNISIPHEDKRERLVEINGDFSLHQPVLVRWQNQEIYAFAGGVVRTAWFDQKFAYTGKLGSDYQKEETSFALWAPTAMEVQLNLYHEGEADAFDCLRLARDAKGVWRGKLVGDCAYLCYNYSLRFPNQMLHITNDPYATAQDPVSKHSLISPFVASKTTTEIQVDQAGMIVDIDQWTKGEENHLKSQFKGKYLAFVADALLGNKEAKLKPFLEQLPVQNLLLYPLYWTKEEELRDARLLNPNYGTQETAYIKTQEEFAYTVQRLHEVGKRVLAILPCGSVYQAETHPLHLTVPGYYFRYDEQGLIIDRWGRGNELASERKMVRAYLMDTLKTWIEHYQLDGFYFPNMYIFHEKWLQEIEQWALTLDRPLTLIADGQQPSQDTITRMDASLYPKVSWINRQLSLALQSFLLGEEEASLRLFQALMANSQMQHCRYLAPQQVWQTLGPLLETDNPEERQQQYFVLTCLFATQGHLLFPLLCKKELVFTFTYSTQQHLHNLLQLWSWRQADTLLHFSTYADLQEASQVLCAETSLLVFSLQGSEYTEIFILNGKAQATTVAIPTGTYEVKVHNNFVQTQAITLKEDFAVEAYSLSVLRRQNDK